MKRNINYLHLAAALVAGLLVLGSLAESAFAQRGGNRSGRSSARASGSPQGGGNNGGNRARINNGQSISSQTRKAGTIKSNVRLKAANATKAKTKTAFQKRGKDVIRNKAHAKGLTKSDLKGHRDRIKHKVKGHVKNHVKNHVKGNIKNHVKKHLHWNWHNGNGYSQATWNRVSNRVNYLRTNRHLHWGFAKWRTYYPAQCHWWYNYCGPQYYFDPTCSVSYNWTYYTVPTTVVDQIVNRNVRWYLGMKCALIPGKGLGIEYVEPNSPADLAGLTPGMFILSANGIVIDREASMPIAIDQSGGQLSMEVLVSQSAEVARVDLALQAVPVTDF